MTRPLRIEYKGAYYHILARGERKDDIFFSEKDKQKFIEILQVAIEKYSLKVHCYVLMNNHYHLLIETPLGNISKAIHYLNSTYSNWLKARYEIIGSVFQGRYKSILIDKESYLTVLSAYIHLNPVRAGVVVNPIEYEWSSCRRYCRETGRHRWIWTMDILSEFSGSRKNYEEFLVNWIKNTDEKTKKDIRNNYPILGNDDFKKNISKYLRSSANSMNSDYTREIPDLKFALKLEMKDVKNVIIKLFHIQEKELFSKKRGNLYRKLFVYGLKNYTDLKLKDIGKIMDMDYSAVSGLGNKFIKESKKDKKIMLMIEKFKKSLSENKLDQCISCIEENGKLRPDP